MSGEALENLLNEDRRFPPAPQFAAAANAQPDLYDEAAADRLAFWDRQARPPAAGSSRWDQVLDWSQAPFARWFVGGRLNVSVNCVDRHVEAGYGDQVAIHFEGEPGDTRTLTYAELLREVSRAAQRAHRARRPGRRPGRDLPADDPGGGDRDAGLRADRRAALGGLRRLLGRGAAQAHRRRRRQGRHHRRRRLPAGHAAALKPAVDEAVAMSPSVQHVLVVRRTGQDVAWDDERTCGGTRSSTGSRTTHTPEAFDAEHPLFILYTSGTTAKPKGILHTTGGYLTQVAYTHRAVFDLKPDTDVYWCTADIGWVTGHSYIVYGPLANGATQVMYEGTPDTPHTGPLVGARREVPASRSSTPRPPRSARS